MGSLRAGRRTLTNTRTHRERETERGLGGQGARICLVVRLACLESCGRGVPGCAEIGGLEIWLFIYRRLRALEFPVHESDQYTWMRRIAALTRRMRPGPTLDQEPPQARRGAQTTRMMSAATITINFICTPVEQPRFGRDGVISSLLFWKDDIARLAAVKIIS
jgi:hypothetical protein